jgi:hypothetical protein
LRFRASDSSGRDANLKVLREQDFINESYSSGGTGGHDACEYFLLQISSTI